MARNWRKIIADDYRNFAYGEIYNIKDELIYFPEALFVGRTFHDVRSVVVIHSCSSNANKNNWTINVAPFSTQIRYKRDTDLEVDPQPGNFIDRKSLIRLGLSQPVLKVDLEGPVGTLTREQLLDLSALQLMLAGTKV